jgi:hypothetical protein
MVASPRNQTLDEKGQPTTVRNTDEIARVVTPEGKMP